MENLLVPSTQGDFYLKYILDELRALRAELRARGPLPTTVQIAPVDPADVVHRLQEPDTTPTGGKKKGR